MYRGVAFKEANLPGGGWPHARRGDQGFGFRPLGGPHEPPPELAVTSMRNLGNSCVSMKDLVPV